MSSSNEPSMTIDDIKELIRVVQETGIAELEVRRGENSVRIKRSASGSQDVVVPAVLPVPVAGVAPPVASVPAATAQDTAPPPAVTPPAPPAEESRDVIVKSPIVGTYYDAPSPGAPPFVKV